MSAHLDFARLVALAAERAALKKLTCSRPADPATVRLSATLCTVGGRTVLQTERLHRDNKATHQNLPLDGALVATLGTLFKGFAQLNLLTTAGDAEYRVTKKGNAVLLGADRLARRLQDGTAASVEVGGNNKKKNYILKGDEPFLIRLGVSDERGRVFDKKQPKFRQINRFLELISDIVPALPEDELYIADLCCGKSYLSFAVYHYFTNVLGRRVTMQGVDLKPDVIEHCAHVARDLGFDGLHFSVGNVAEFTPARDLDLVVSLHACDTATDLVLDRALAGKACVILATPCCHHELNHTLSCPALSFVAEHSMLRQKLCDAATDALRLKRLQSCGYDVAALELIDPDETPKNIMLRAIRRPDAGSGSALEKRAAEEYRAARAFLLGE